VFDALTAMGHRAVPVGNVAGGVNAIHFGDDGMMEGAACWRADGTPIALGGGLARAGVCFRPEAGLGPAGR
jgi:gamma-glutamyltranspeptidase/glutathione hydrolase